MPSSFERREQHEQVGGAVALVLVIVTGRASRFHRDRHPRFGNELLRGLVTEISFAAMIASVANSGDKSESLNPFKLVEAGD